MSRTTSRSSSRPGFFLVIEGPDGSGKTTLARRLVRHYRAAGWSVRSVREPGGTRLSERIRRLILYGRQQAVGARAELFLYLAARAQLVEEVLRPALAKGEMVIADRFGLSTYAYQSGGRGLPLAQVVSADRIARDDLAPDLTLVLRLSDSEARRRLTLGGRPPDRIESESARFRRAVNAFYRSWGARRPNHSIIAAAASPAGVFNQAKEAVDRHLPRLAGGQSRRTGRATS